MAVSEEYREYILERLECVGDVFSKKMFGGLGLYLNGVFFALVSDNILYFKVDDSSRPDFEEEGMQPFQPYGDGSYSMSYYEVPESVIENDQALMAWSQKAYNVALSSRKKKSGRKKRRKSE